MKIVIIDDDMLVTGALKTILEAGEEITVAATGQDGSEAMSLYQTYRPDVLLMDIRMQKVSGLDAAKEILLEYPEARILLLTTFSDYEVFGQIKPVFSRVCGTSIQILQQNCNKFATHNAG